MNSIFDDAVASVKRRGFLSDDNPANRRGLITGQFARLVEEVGETGRALRKDDLTAMRVEVADVVIVCANLYYILCADDGDLPDLASMIQSKLRADERRGYLHQGGSDEEE